MLGFVNNYSLQNLGNLGNADTIMNCFAPNVVPVMSSLAYHLWRVRSLVCFDSIADSLQSLVRGGRNVFGLRQ